MDKTKTKDSVKLNLRFIFNVLHEKGLLSDLEYTNSINRIGKRGC